MPRKSHHGTPPVCRTDRRAVSPNRCVSTPCTPTPEVTVYYLGIDLHKDESHVAVLDDDAEVVEEIRVKSANLDDVAEEYAGAKAALEATMPC